MKEIFSFFHGIGNLLKNLSKNMYRRCALITVGTVVIAVVSFNSTCYGGTGKNNVTSGIAGNTCESDKEDTDISDEETEDTVKNLLSADQGIETQQFPYCLLGYNADLGKVAEIEYAHGEVLMSRMSDVMVVEADEDDEYSIENVVLGDTVIPYIMEVTDEDYMNLVRIIEAEATDLDLMAKILVANVVINRVNSYKFPNTVTDVIFQENGAQFQPIKDGRFYSVELTNSSYEAATAALCGEDYSEGALYFASIASAGPDSWFARSLVRLFEYNGHVFFKEH